MPLRQPLPEATFHDVRAALLAGDEIAFLDVREEAPHAEAHPLFAANFPRGRIELDAYAKLPRRDVPIVLIDDHGAPGGEAELAAARLRELGYADLRRLTGGVAGWRDAGGELFRDVNVPSKAFGELVEAQRHTPSLSAEEVKARIEAGADLVIVDARRFDEYRTMSIPGAISVPGAELALRVPALAPRPETQVVVNCAGRTRSIIGTQSLINAGLPNPVAALRNGTIGWTLAGLTLDHRQTRQAADVPAAVRATASIRARTVADRAGVRRAGRYALDRWRRQDGRSTYFFDLRSEVEFVAGHLPGFRPVAGGQLVQETEMVAPVRGARLVLADSDGVRANMSASWLAQMGWEVHVVDDLQATDFGAKGHWQAPLPALPEVGSISVAMLAGELGSESTQIIDFGPSPAYRRGHVPGAWFVLRSDLPAALAGLPAARRLIVTAEDEALAHFAAAEAATIHGGEVFVLAGGNPAWRASGLRQESGEARLASPPIDRYRRPYEGTDAPRQAMQAYLDWEFGLVEQLARDGTHGFRVL